MRASRNSKNISFPNVFEQIRIEHETHVEATRVNLSTFMTPPQITKTSFLQRFSKIHKHFLSHLMKALLRAREANHSFC